MRVERRTGRTGGRQRIDYSEAEQMLRAGFTQQEVADRFDVSQAAVSRAIVRGRIKDVDYDRSPVAHSGVPWHPIRLEHRSKYLVRMLRAAKRREQGKQSAAVIEAELDKFLERVKELNFVVHYDPDTEEGFWRVPRREGIDTGLVRNPFLDDEGDPVARHASNDHGLDPSRGISDASRDVPKGPMLHLRPAILRPREGVGRGTGDQP